MGLSHPNCEGGHVTTLLEADLISVGVGAGAGGKRDSVAGRENHLHEGFAWGLACSRNYPEVPGD